MPNNQLIDNSSSALAMVEHLKRYFADEAISTVMIATGYWDIPGLSLLTDEIDAFLSRPGTRLQLLIGKDPYVYATQLKNVKKKDPKYPEDFIRTAINALEVCTEYAKAIRLLMQYCSDDASPKIEIRIYRANEHADTQFLHSKCYIFDGLSQGVGYGIVGSSNFTQKGLEGNAELNYLETSPQIVLSQTPIPNSKSHIQWFQEKWTLAERWNKVFLEQILKPAPITQRVIAEAPLPPFTPYELYIKLLQLLFGDIVDKNLTQQIEASLPLGISKLDYQIDAVKRCLNIMHEHGGFILADVVGLGKTIVGALLIKCFLTFPEDDGRERQVLIITPPAIQSSWKKTIAQFDTVDEKLSPSIDYITTGRIDSLIPEDGDDREDAGDSGEFTGALQKKNYGLILIDESHKFRNSNTQMYRELDDLIQCIGFTTGVYPYIGLLSATPQNNRPDDVKNQIYLFERNHTVSTLKKAADGNLERFFSEINNEYNNLKNLAATERKTTLTNLSTRLRECVLDDILERRTRTDIKKYYHADIAKQGLVFPTVQGPNNLVYRLDDTLAQLFYDTMAIIDHRSDEQRQDFLHYYRHRAIEFLTDLDNRRKYEGRGNRDVTTIADQLATIMQILLVKRLESSFTAFRQSLLNLRQYTKNMIDMWDNDTIFICPQIDINKELNSKEKTKRRGYEVSFNECVADVRKKIEKLTAEGRNNKGQNAEYRRQDFDERYITLIREDYEIISALYERWRDQQEVDPKLDTFKEILTPMLFNASTNTSGKLVIFSEAIDTVNILTRVVRAKGYKVLPITAANRDANEETIIENFDANYEGEWKDDYNVIITTEVLAEGVNLHRANVILNYDTPWNATRLMQRIGRVNRIASKKPFDNIYVYNFLPSAQGNAQIQLVQKAYNKLQSFHILFGEDNKIFSEEEDIFHYEINREIEGEESPLQKYVYELKQYKESHSERYALIAATDTGWEIATATNGVAYFLVRRPRAAQLFLRISSPSHPPQTMAMTDFLTALHEETTTPCVPLPDDWQALRETAKEEYIHMLLSFHKVPANHIRTKAVDAIVDLYYTEGLSPQAQHMLQQARVIVESGNNDLAKKIVEINKEIHAPSLTPIPLSEIEQLLQKHIARIVTNINSEQGAPQIIIGTVK